MDFREIHIGQLLEKKVIESGIELSRICNFLQVGSEEVQKMYTSDDINIHILLRWSKLLEYDFFRLYSQHLILYAPAGSIHYNKLKKTKKSHLPEFRKNIYTIELIDFIIELISSGKKTKFEIIEDYGIPKTTLYKWISKSQIEDEKQ